MIFDIINRLLETPWGLSGAIIMVWVVSRALVHVLVGYPTTGNGVSKKEISDLRKDIKVLREALEDSPSYQHEIAGVDERLQRIEAGFVGSPFRARVPSFPSGQDLDSTIMDGTGQFVKNSND